MSDRYTRITVPLSKDEFEALRDAASREYRHPREQARFILHQVLLGSGSVDVMDEGKPDTSRDGDLCK